MKVCWDQTKQRVVACGLDQQIKVFEIITEGQELQLKLSYKAKMPGPIF